MTNKLTLETVRRGMIVQLAIPACRPYKLLSGVLHEAGDDYKILGTHGTLVRLSRVRDCEKIMVVAEDLFVEIVIPPPTRRAPGVLVSMKQ